MTVCLTIFSVNLESMNTVRQIIHSSHNGTVPVQVSSNQQQQNDELQCDFTRSDVQEVRRRKFFVLMKSLFEQDDSLTAASSTHRRQDHCLKMKTWIRDGVFRVCRATCGSATISKSGADYSDHSFSTRLFQLFVGLFRLFLSIIQMDYSGLFRVQFFLDYSDYSVWIIPSVLFFSRLFRLLCLLRLLRIIVLNLNYSDYCQYLQ